MAEKWPLWRLLVATSDATYS